MRLCVLSLIWSIFLGSFVKLAPLYYKLVDATRIVLPRPFGHMYVCLWSNNLLMVRFIFSC